MNFRDQYPRDDSNDLGYVNHELAETHQRELRAKAIARAKVEAAAAVAKYGPITMPMPSVADPSEEDPNEPEMVAVGPTCSCRLCCCSCGAR